MPIGTSDGEYFEDQFEFHRAQFEKTGPDVQFPGMKSEEELQAWNEKMAVVPHVDMEDIPEEYRRPYFNMTVEQSMKEAPEPLKIPEGATLEDIRKLQEEFDKKQLLDFNVKDSKVLPGSPGFEDLKEDFGDEKP